MLVKVGPGQAYDSTVFAGNIFKRKILQVFMENKLDIIIRLLNEINEKLGRLNNNHPVKDIVTQKKPPAKKSYKQQMVEYLKEIYKDDARQAKIKYAPEIEELRLLKLKLERE